MFDNINCMGFIVTMTTNDPRMYAIHYSILDHLYVNELCSFQNNALFILMLM